MNHHIVWKPTNPHNSRLWHFMQIAAAHPFNDYPAFYQWSIEHPELFWTALVDYFDIKWTTPPTEIINTYLDPLDARWFTGATFNYAQHLLRRNDEHPALICVTESGKRDVISYRTLNQSVAACATGLKSLGINPGDRVAAVMPNVAQTIIAMLATASLGAIWSSCSCDFGAEAIIDRLGQIEPKVLFIADGQQYAGKKHSSNDKIKAITESIPSIEHLIICPIINSQYPFKSGDIKPNVHYWNNILHSEATPSFVSLPFNHPLLILFSSGTTGKPKCIVHGAGGTLLQHLKELGLHTNLTEDDNLCFFTTCGWMMWNWMLSTLALGATLTLYEGSPTYPEPCRLFEVINQEHVTVLGTSAKYLSTLEKGAHFPADDFQSATLKTILSTGSPLLPQQYDFVHQHIKAGLQISSISGGTDIVSCFALGNPLLPVYRGELQCVGLGMDVKVFNEQGKPVLTERGELVCMNAFPSMPLYFWNDPNKVNYRKAYFERFPNIWTHGDFAELTKHHGIIIYGRSDTVLNPGGVRIGTAEIYRQLQTIPEIVDSVVIGQEWDNDIRIVLFIKLRYDVVLNEELIKHIRETIRHNASPRHVPAIILDVPDIPRTINGKVVELAVRQVVHHQPITNLQSLANPESLKYFADRATN